MKKMRMIAERGDERFEIVEASEGFYVFRYENGQNTHDFLQDDMPMAIRCALDEWAVPSELWRQVQVDD